MVMGVLVETSVNVSWETVTFPGIMSYTVYYRPTGSDEGESERSVIVPSSQSSVVIEGLVSNVEYKFQVAAVAELEGILHPGERSSAAQPIGHHETPTLTSNLL